MRNQAETNARAPAAAIVVIALNLTLPFTRPS